MTDLFNTTSTSAAISLCGRYRYSLGRTWDTAIPPVCFIMLNPSTADAVTDDPTIRRCMGFAKSWGAGGIVVVNLFALRSTDPTVLHRDSFGAIGPHNDHHILRETEGRHIIAAWGVHGCVAGRDKAVMRILEGRSVECLGLTKAGHPRHPLYVPASMKPVKFVCH